MNNFKTFYEDYDDVIENKTLSKLMTECYDITTSKGFDVGNIEEQLIALMAEFGELCEAYRKTKSINSFNFREELADIVIRILSFAEGNWIPLTSFIEIKKEYNKTREYKHGKKF